VNPATETQLLDVSSVSVSYGGRTVLDRLSLTVRPGEVVGLVGESGCGKTTLAWSVLGLLPRHARLSGAVRFLGQDLGRMTPRRKRNLLGNELSFVPQSAMASLDPMYSVRRQLREICTAGGQRGAEADARIAQMLKRVGLSADEVLLRAYPHQLSGGMRQRVTIAAAMLLSPALIIADEPTSSLDVTSQAQVLATFRALIDEQHTAVVLITHDLGVVAQFCERVAVMYAGQIVEDGRVADIFASPKHPYTRLLLAAHPGAQPSGQRLTTIPGSVPEPAAGPHSGCPFSPRCPDAMQACERDPAWTLLDGGRYVRCVQHQH
jgi:peptide/nickel transport system ATP-binding protein